MVITYQGVQSFRVQFGDTVLAFDPISKDSKFKSGSFGADIALVSLNHPDMNGVGQANRGDKTAFVINSPGEYEVGGVFIKGLPSSSKYAGEDRINTIYYVNLEGMNLCFLGALSGELPSRVKSEIEDIDILFVPVSGNGVLSPAEAEKIAVSLEPKLVIPMNFEAGKVELKAFLKEGGAPDTKPVDKLTIKRKDLEGKLCEIAVLSEQ